MTNRKIPNSQGPIWLASSFFYMEGGVREDAGTCLSLIGGAFGS